MKGFQVHLGIPPMQGLACFRVLDSDADGSISKEEWLRAFEALPQELFNNSLKAHFRSGLLSREPIETCSPTSVDDLSFEVSRRSELPLTQSEPSSPRRSVSVLYRSLEKLLPESPSDTSTEAPRYCRQTTDFHECISLMADYRLADQSRIQTELDKLAVVTAQLQASEQLKRTLLERDLGETEQHSRCNRRRS